MYRLVYITLLFVLFAACESPEQDISEMEKMIAQINKKCPTLIDSETQLDGIEFKDDNTLRYNYTLVNVFVSNIDTHAFNLSMWPGILSTIKVSPEMQKLRENKMNVQYYYQDRARQPIYTFKVSPSDYLK